MCYFSMIFTDLANSEKERYNYGWILVGLIVITFFFNILFIIKSIFRAIRLLIVKYWIRIKYYCDRIKSIYYNEVEINDPDHIVIDH